MARERRYRHICELVKLQPEHTVLDVGCGSGRSFETFNHVNPITGVDLHTDPPFSQGNFRYICGDGADLSRFRNSEFDVAFCVGVLEHVFPRSKLERVADEIRRVGKSYAIVVPHTFTLVEPHHQLPFWQFYPDQLKSFLARRVSISSYPKNPQGEFRQLNYLPRDQWQALFPDAMIVAYNHVRPGLVWDYIFFRRA